MRIFDAIDHGAVGDGRVLDTAALQRAIDACAAAGGGRVLVRGTRWYRVGTLRLRGRVDLHLAEGATLRASLDPRDYTEPALVVADDAEGIAVTGPGRIEGRATDFMAGWDDEAWIYTPKPWRPRMFALRRCADVTVTDITLADAPFWGLHLLGCTHVGVARLRVRNNLEVPNCDGVDVDHCRDVEIADCSIHTGDDAIVVKATGAADGPVRGVRVRDCELVTQDSALKIGTETTADIADVRFERCSVPACNRACTIQLRDGGDVHDVTFADVTFDARHFATPWWGHGEGISVTARPRAEGTRLGRVSGVRFQRVEGVAENSLRLDGAPGSRLADVLLDRVAVRLERWTGFAGGLYDDRPTAGPGLVPHGTPAIHVSHADRVTLREVSVTWGRPVPDSFTHALEAVDVRELDLAGFRGAAARAGLPAVRRRSGD